MTTAYETLMSKATEMFEGSKVTAFNGTPIYTPDGKAKYNALWTRDFGYMVEYAGDLMPQEDISAGIQYIIDNVREDGWIPDRIYGDGLAVFEAGGIGTPIGRANLDNGPFLVSMVKAYLQSLSNEAAAAQFNLWADTLAVGMTLIPRGENGLVYNDPEKPHSPYGFTDTVCKTGYLLFESLLYWKASLDLTWMYHNYLPGNSLENMFSQAALMIEKNLDLLYDEQESLFYAATQDCRQLDVWGNLFALHIDFPLGEKKDAMEATLVRRYKDYVVDGQLRHLFTDDPWDRTLMKVPYGEYQNGAYWATPTGWLLELLREKDNILHNECLSDILSYFNEVGIFECVNGDYKKLETFVVSVANVYGYVKTLN